MTIVQICISTIVLDGGDDGDGRDGGDDGDDHDYDGDVDVDVDMVDLAVDLVDDGWMMWMVSMRRLLKIAMDCGNNWG